MNDLKVHLVRMPKSRKRILLGQMAIRVRDMIRQITTEHEMEILSGKAACDHVHLFVGYHSDQSANKLVQYLKVISSRIIFQGFSHVRKQLWGRHFWARRYFAVFPGTISDEMIRQNIDEQEGESVQDCRFQINS